jgi:hypothetical protein
VKQNTSLAFQCVRPRNIQELQKFTNTKNYNNVKSQYYSKLHSNVKLAHKGKQIYSKPLSLQLPHTYQYPIKGEVVFSFVAD